MIQKKHLLFSLFVLALVFAQAFDAFAFSLVREIPIELDEEFKLYAGQAVNLESEHVLIEASSIYPAPECSEGQPCIAVVSSVNLLVSKLYGSEETRVWAQTKVHLTEGASEEVFGLKLTNTGIFKGDYEFSLEPDYATFIVSKPVKETVIAELGEEFKLSVLGTALVQKKGETVVKMTLNKLVDTGKAVYASVTASTTAGDPAEIAELTIKEEESAAIGKYLVYFNEATSASYGAFVVKEKETLPETIYVGLNEKFELLEKQRAIVKETGLNIYLRTIGQDKIYCITADNSGSCPEGTYFVALDILVPYYYEESSAASGSGAAGVIATTDSAVLQKTIAAGTGKTIYLHANETAEVFGHAISALELTGETGVFSVTKKTSPETIRAYLNEKFKLKEEQTAIILSKNEEVMKLTLNDFVLMGCTASSENYVSRCDSRVIASVTASTKANYESGGGSGAALLKIYEGEEVPFQGYYIRFADYEDGFGVFVVREGLSERLIKVRINEKFELGEKQTALVVEEDLYIRLNNIAILKSNPPQNIAYISVWKEFIVYEDEIEKKLVAEYGLRAGEELDLYGVKIKALEVGAGEAAFIVTKKGTSIINVHVNEPFSLSENQVARVLEANIRMELLKVASMVACPDIGMAGEETTETTTDTYSCTEDKFVEISVSGYLSGETAVGEKVEKERIESTVVSTTDIAEKSAAGEVTGVSTESIVVEEARQEAIEILVPPKPFEVFTLREGESVEVNDFEIKVLSIGSSEAKFIVKKN